MHQRTVDSTGAEDFAWKLFWNQNMRTEQPQNACIDAFFCIISLTGASVISSLDCHVISSLH
jgi:hypothetical protein